MTSRLTVGKERIPANPPRGAPPCSEPIVYGTNILKDPGFELQLANCPDPYGLDQIPAGGTDVDGDFYGCPSAIDLAFYNSSGSLTCAPATTGWFAESITTGNLRERFYVSTVNPRSGTFHARFNKGAATAIAVNTRLAAYGFYDCATTQLEPGDPSAPHVWSFRAMPGDFVSMSVWAEASTLTGAPYLEYNFRIVDSAGSSMGSFLSANLPITTTYAQYSYPLFMPSTASPPLYVKARVTVRATSSFPLGGNVDLDDFVLQVSK